MTLQITPPPATVRTRIRRPPQRMRLVSAILKSLWTFAAIPMPAWVARSCNGLKTVSACLLPRWTTALETTDFHHCLLHRMERSRVVPTAKRSSRAVRPPPPPRRTRLSSPRLRRCCHPPLTQRTCTAIIIMEDPRSGEPRLLQLRKKISSQRKNSH